jgi:phosphohistidine phosphatase
MKLLTILRHAKSSWADTSLKDRDRPLNKRGKRDAPMMAERINRAGIRPSLILSSPAVRAWSTAKAVAREITYPIEFLQREPDMYMANLQTLIHVIGNQDNGFNSILIVGHNPGLTDLANFLVPGLTDNIPTCGMVTVRIAADNWNLREAEEIELVSYDYPKKPQ